MRSILFAIVIVFWFSLTAFAACDWRCTPVGEFVLPISGGTCATHRIVRGGKIYQCVGTKRVGRVKV